MDPLAVLAYGAEQAPPLIGMEWNGKLWTRHRLVTDFKM